MALQSCSNDETTLVSGAENSFFPLISGNFWNYNNDSQNNNALRDSLFIEKDTTINNIIYKKFKTQNPPIGFYSNVINGNSLRQNGDKILLTGNAGLDFAANLPVDLALNDFVIFSANAAENTELSAKSGVLNQNAGGLPLTLTYNLKSVAMASMPTYTTPGGKTYTNVKPIKIIFNLKLTTTFAPLPIAIPILNAQDVITSTLYYAKNIGVVYANTRVKYELQALPLPPNVNLPIPASGDETFEEFLTTYKSN